MIFRNADLLIKQLNEDNSRFAIKVIAIDGKDGVGKSTLAKKIAINLNGSYLELDQFIEKNKGHYVSAIKKDDLLNEIRNNSNKKPVLIEGICAQEVLKSLKAVSGLGIKIVLNTSKPIFARGLSEIVKRAKLNNLHITFSGFIPISGFTGRRRG